MLPVRNSRVAGGVPQNAAPGGPRRYIPPNRRNVAPGGAPWNAASMRAPQNAAPMRAPQNAAPMRAPRNPAPGGPRYVAPGGAPTVDEAPQPMSRNTSYPVNDK